MHMSDSSKYLAHVTVTEGDMDSRHTPYVPFCQQNCDIADSDLLTVTSSPRLPSTFEPAHCLDACLDRHRISTIFPESSIMKETSMASFSSLPPEIDAIIFHHLFKNSRVQLSRCRNESPHWELDLHPSHITSILYTSRRFHEEARMILAASVKLVFRNVRPVDIQSSAAEYYYPRIRTIDVEFKTDLSAVDFAPFVALELMMDLGAAW